MSGISINVSSIDSLYAAVQLFGFSDANSKAD